MKHLLLILLGILAVGAQSCSQSEEPVYDKQTSLLENDGSNPYKVSLGEALNSADALLQELDGIKTRKQRLIRDVKYIERNHVGTRGATGGDTLLYIVNFDDNEGFAILGADTRVDAVYALSNQGELDLSDTAKNESFALCMRQIRYAANRSFELYIDTTKFNGTIGGGDSGYIKPVDDRKITYYTKIIPKLKKFANRWGQYYPYNRYCGDPDYPDNVGCVSLACAQIMSYHKWPETYLGVNINWDVINDWDFEVSGSVYPSCPSKLSGFLNQIGLALNAKGHTRRVIEEDIINNFYKFGYEPIGQAVALDRNSAKQALNTTPLLVVADLNNRPGHCWVIDGYLEYKETWSAIANETHSHYYSLYHCVWGWDGINNGYFSWIADSNNGSTIPTQFDGVDSRETGNNYNYDFLNIRYWSHIVPVK